MRIEVWPIRLAVSKSPLPGASSPATSAGGVVGVVAAVAGIGGVVVSPATIGVVAVVRLAAIVRLDTIVVAALERRCAIGVAAALPGPEFSRKQQPAR